MSQVTDIDVAAFVIIVSFPLPLFPPLRYCFLYNLLLLVPVLVEVLLTVANCQTQKAKRPREGSILCKGACLRDLAMEEGSLVDQRWKKHTHTSTHSHTHTHTYLVLVFKSSLATS